MSTYTISFTTPNDFAEQQAGLFKTYFIGVLHEIEQGYIVLENFALAGAARPMVAAGQFIWPAFACLRWCSREAWT